MDKADRLEPRWNREWLEYMQARGLACDPARVRIPGISRGSRPA